MSTIHHRTIHALRNPVTQALDGSAYDETRQRIGVPRDVFAIAIAPDSQVDLVRLYLNGIGDFNESILVSADHPWVGHLDATRVQNLVAVPVRSVGTVDGVADVDGVIMAKYPRLKLELYTDEPPAVVPAGLAPFRMETAGTTADDANVDVAFPLMGRTRVGVAFVLGNYTGNLAGLAVTATLALTGFAIKADGTVVPITRSVTLTRNADTFGELYETDGVNSGGSTSAGWVHWVMGRLTLDGGVASPNTFDYNVLIGAR